MLKKIKKYVGILIKSHEIVAIEVISKKGKPEVTNYSKLSLEKNIIEASAVVVDKEKFKEAINELLKTGANGRIKTEEVYIAIPEESTFSHKITIPAERKEDLEYIKEKAKDFIPIELDEAVFDYKIIKENEKQKTISIRFIATQNSIIESLIDSFKAVGIQVTKAGVNIESLIKSFDNPLSKNEGDFCVINMDLERDLMSINLKNGESYKLISRRGEANTLEKLKKCLNLSTKTEIQEQLIKVKKDGEFGMEAKQKLTAEFEEHLVEIERKLVSLLKVSEAHGQVSIQKVYLTGILSKLPTIKERLEKVFPGIITKSSIEYSHIPEEAENHILEGIGIGINEVIGSSEKDFNLLPEARKEELSMAQIIPSMKRYLIVAILILVAPLVQLSIGATRNYIDYKVKSQEVVILNEQSLNPYLRGIAKMKREREQVQQQILAVLDNSVPVSFIMKSIDSYNKDGVYIKGVSYRDNKDNNISEIMLTAEIENREKTEEFIEELEKSKLYENVISPLSNLVGKAKRLVKIDLTANNDTVIDIFNNKDAESKNE